MKTVKVTHELDNLFDVEPGNTEITVPGSDVVPVPHSEQPATQELVVASDPAQYDDRDYNIDAELEDVRRKAVEAFETLMVEAQAVVDKRYAPQLGEVAAKFLDTALKSISEKAMVKGRKDKIQATQKPHGPAGAASGITNNNIFTDRSTLLKLLRGEQDIEH